MNINLFTPPIFSREGKIGSLRSFLLLVVMLIAATSNSFAQETYEILEGLRYLLDTDAKTATVVAKYNEWYSGDIVIPEKVKASDGTEYHVTALGDYAFQHCDRLTSIVIPSSVISLGKRCFCACN